MTFRNSPSVVAACLMCLFNATAYADVVHNENVIIGPDSYNDHLCVGKDCAEGELFGDENITIKDSYPGLLFVDTDPGATDWFIAINGSSDRLRILDLGALTFPVMIDGGTPSAALFLEAVTGDVGFGTALPQKELHVVDSSQPTLRLEQDSTNGFPQV